MKHACVIGAGITGQSLKKLLTNQGYLVYMVDDNHENKIDNHLLYIDFDLLVKSPGVDPRHPILKQLAEKYRLYGDLEVASWFTDKFSYAAITGTNGKTTVTECLNHLLEYGNKPHYKAGNVGVALSDIVFLHGETPANIALECSSFQLEEIEKLKPTVATILNLTPDHLNRYDRVEDYYAAKFNILKSMTKHDTFLLNLDEPLITTLMPHTDAQIATYSINQVADIQVIDEQVWFKKQVLFRLNDINLVGKHNLSNLMVAGAMAVMMGVPIEKISLGIQSFQGVEHRIEKVAVVNGVTYYNDSKATNPDATIVAMNAFEGNVHLILGGYDKKISYQPLTNVASKCKQIYVFGETKFLLKEIFEMAIVCEDLQEVMLQVDQHISAGDVVLFSPASASYDQFQNYEQRGKRFKELVLNRMDR